ncbi:MAG: L-serine ammonia-lyase, iron-sulfur-dependent, subunit alpha [Firmicutes bacterium]|jgi:L-cysteine desulfidase|nr:L-serine ammonia-lyase, iron-sulfur-dependent, subunit alpha [Bacillota bacterium]MDH7494789.1 L-serine ammonia-lyase, iron-sulfur-dependent, subunit alpha [Bacillota bacterium]
MLYTEGEYSVVSLKEFLQSEVKPALGCTEPGAVALAVARACEELDRARVHSVKVVVSDSVYKNGMAVGIPGSNGAKGNAVAAALAVFTGRSAYGLEVLKDSRPSDVARAEEWVRTGRVKVLRHPEKSGVYVEAVVSSQGTPCHEASCVIEGEHSNIVKVTIDGKVVFEKPLLREDESGDAVRSARDGSVSEAIGTMTYSEVIRLADQMDDEDVRFLMEGARLNKRIAEYGLEKGSISGLGLGKGMKTLLDQRRLGEDLGYLIKAYCYAAADARMAGAPLAVMSSAGSGNHGITAVLPVYLVGEALLKSEREVARAIAQSHLSTSFVKSRIGRLSSVCGCVVAAGAGAAAGMVFLMGGDEKGAIQAMQTVLADTAGMVCDGAKESCSLRVGVGAGEAYLAALFALEGMGFSTPQGLVDTSIEKTIDNVKLLNKVGMRQVDSVLIDIMESRN